MRRRLLKLWAGIILMVVTLASLGVLGWTINHKAYLRFCDGVVIEVAHGAFKIHVWDTSFYRIEYPKGLSFGDNHERMWFWRPMVHLNEPPAYYAAPGFHQWVVMVPLWMVGVGAGIGMWHAKRAGWLGRPAGLCPECGYDVRGLMNRTCPECGEHLCSAPSYGHHSAGSGQWPDARPV